MVGRLLLIYVVLEVLVLVALAETIGFGWTLVVLVATFVLGLVLWAPMGGWQLSRQLGQLRSGLSEPGSALSDGALVTVATGLVLVPGLVSTTLGLLLLVPPIRAIARPGLTAIAVRGFLRRVPLTTEAAAGLADALNLRKTDAGRDFIDGEVIDVRDVDPDIDDDIDEHFDYDLDEDVAPDVDEVSIELPVLWQGPIAGEPTARPASSPGSV